MLDRDQVLHVARLARLKLSDEEVERFAREISTILEHIDTINEIEGIEDVEPTSHVVEVENVLRADVPRPSFERERILEGAPDATDQGFRVPSPGAS